MTGTGVRHNITTVSTPQATWHALPEVVHHLWSYLAMVWQSFGCADLFLLQRTVSQHDALEARQAPFTGTSTGCFEQDYGQGLCLLSVVGVLPFVIYPVDSVDYAPMSALMHLLLGPDGGSSRQNAVGWVSLSTTQNIPTFVACCYHV
jgi:hypothetical protein